MISNSSFIKQFKALEHSKNFKEIANDTGPICMIGEEIRDDEKFKEGIRLYAELLKETYPKLC